MSELLTTRELQDLLKVDRITIYRMLDQGRLPGFKVGGQWRFSRRDIENWLETQRDLLGTSAVDASAEIPLEPDVRSLPLHCIQAMQDIFAEAVDVASLTVSPEGKRLTPISRLCGFCALIQGTGAGRRQCELSWREMAARADDGDVSLRKCHAGLFCAASAIRVAEKTIAATVAGQILFSPPGGKEWKRHCEAVSSACQVPVEELLRASESIRVHEPERAPRTVSLLGRLAETFSEISHERLALIERLRRIAEMSAVDGLIADSGL